MRINLYNQYTISVFRCFIILLLGVFQQKSFAQQKEVIPQSLYWTRYYNQLSINPQWTWHNEIDNRRFFNNNKQHHLIIHSHVHYKIHPSFDAAVGLTYSRQSPQFPDAPSALVVPEIRPFQEFNFTAAISKRLSLGQRLRIDERFIHKNNGKALLDGYDFNFRVRFRLQANMIVSKAISMNQTTLKIANELMVNAGSSIALNPFDQNRIYLGIEQNLGKKASVELGYLHWYQQRSSGYQFFKRDIIRLTLYHRIKLKSL